MPPARTTRARQVLTFGSYCLDTTAKVLLRNGEPVHLSRKAVETLLVLVENCGRVVPKAELMAAVWPDRVVEEANLAQNIAVVRKALGAEPGEPGHIETFPGRGYRILGPVSSAAETPAPIPDAKTPARRVRRLWFAGAAVLVVAAGIGVWLGPGWRSPTEPREFRRTPVTRFAGKEYQPAVSPDGSQVAFVWEQEPHKPAQIWVQAAGDTQPRQVSQGPGRHSSPAWSPDGRALAYLRLSETTGEIVIASFPGGSERSLTGVFPTRFGLPHRHLDWSPDGRLLAVDDAASATEPLGIFLVSVATGEKERLTDVEAPYIGDVEPRFSPDGRRVAFIRVFHRARQELYFVPSQGGQPEQLTADAKQISGHDWMADGRWLAFGSDRDGSFKLWKIRPEAPAPRETIAFTGIYADYPIQPSIGRTAPVLVYSVLPQDFNVWRLDLREAQKGNPDWARVIASPVMDASPQYSPDGGRIVFRSDRSGEEQLWVAHADGSNPLQITQGHLRPSVGRWSPDGRSIVFNNSQDTSIHIATEEERGRWTTRGLGVLGIHPVFSPNGKWIYAGSPAGILRIPAAGGAPERLGETNALSLGISADGRSVYFVREPAGASLWVLDTESKEMSKVLDGLVPYCSSCWAVAPDGVYYLRAEGRPQERQAVHFREFATGRDRLVVEYPEPLLPIGSGPFSLSPGGRYLLCVRVDPSNSDIVRVEPFR